MSRITKSIRTNYTASEMKNYVSTEVLPNKALSSLLSSAIWVGDTLKLESKFGRGTIELFDNLVNINIELSFMGSLARRTIEGTLDTEFKRLKS